MDAERSRMMPGAARGFDPRQLGSAAFRRRYGVRYAYLAGAMYKGIASKEMVIALARAGLMGYFGAGGLSLQEIEENIRAIKAALPKDEPFGMNLLANSGSLEDDTVSSYLRLGVRNVEASSYMQLSEAVVRFRLTGARVLANGTLDVPNRVLAKISRPETATLFLRPPPALLVRRLVEKGALSAAEAELAAHIPVADDLCVEADSGGHTDRGRAIVIVPAICQLRDHIMREQRYARHICVGAAGGLGTPDSIAAALMLGAEFVLTGSINQCTVEAATSDAVKDILADVGVQDTDYAPAGDLFELGSKVQVVKKGLFFAARANKLYELYSRHASLEEIDETTRATLQNKYFQRSFDEVWRETRGYLVEAFPERVAAIESNPKQKMAMIFRWYFIHTTRLALHGRPGKVDYQIHCGPAMGAFNQWVEKTELKHWRNRKVADIGIRLMDAAAASLATRFAQLSNEES